MTLRFTETGITSDWTALFNSEDGNSIYLAVLNYAVENAFEAVGNLSEYALQQGYKTDTAWTIYTDGKEHAVEISYNVDGSIDFYRDGHLMLTYPAGTAVGRSTAQYAVKGIAEGFAAGTYTVKYPIKDFSISFAKDYDSSAAGEDAEAEKTVMASVGTKNDDGTYSLAWNNYKNFYKMTAPAGDFETTLSFHQEGKLPDGNWDSFAVAMTEDLNKETQSDADWYLRSDHYSNSKFSGSEVYLAANYNWDTFRKDMQDADVEMTIKRVGSNILVTSDILTAAGKNYQYTAMAVNVPTQKLAVYLGGEAVYLSIYKAKMDSLSLSKTAGSNIIATVGTKNEDGSYTLAWDDYDNFYSIKNLKGDFEAVFTFDHASQSANQWDAFMLAARNDGFLWHTRADAWTISSTGVRESQYVNSVGGDWNAYKETNKDSKITLYVTRAGKTLNYIAHIEGADGKSYEYAAVSYGGTTEPLELLLGGENCQLTVRGSGAKGITRTALNASGSPESNTGSRSGSANRSNSSSGSSASASNQTGAGSTAASTANSAATPAANTANTNNAGNAASAPAANTANASDKTTAPDNAQNPAAQEGTAAAETGEGLKENAVSVGDEVVNDNASDQGKYKVASDSTVTCMKPSAKKASVTVPAVITVNGKTYQVTQLAKGAFKGNTTIKKVTLGKNITTIGKEAFKGAKNLKKIKIKSSQIIKIGKNAFKGINKKATIILKKKNFAKIKKLIKESGVPDTVTFKKK